MIKFDESTHTYTNENGEVLISTTQLMQKHGLAPNYANVPSEVLRAKAERGTLIHKEIEDFIKNRELGFTTELQNFITYLMDNNIKVLSSERLVNNDIVAGTLDLLLEYPNGEIVIADVKTTSTLHKEPVSWQLTIYDYLGETNAVQGQAFHFQNDGTLKVVDVQLKPKEEIDRLMECERNGLVFEPKNYLEGNKDIIELGKVETLIASIEAQKKEAEAKAKDLRRAIMQAMEENGVKSFENDVIKLTYVGAITKTTIDTARLKKELPNIAKDFEKTTETKPSLRITLKEQKQ